MHRIILPMLAAALLVSGAAAAQTIPADSLNSMLEQAKACYLNAEYEKAISQLEKIIQFPSLLNVNEQAEVYKYLAFSYVAFGDTYKAKEQFKKLLALNPGLDLDPVTVSPKITRVFEETKSEMPPTAGALLPSDQSSKSRFDALWRSCLMPGWGQRYLGETGKGNKMTTAAGISLGTVLLSGISACLAHSAYNNAAPSSITDAYRSYKILYNVSSFCIASFIGIYLYNVGDAIFAGGKEPSSMIDPGRDYRREAGRFSVYLCGVFDF